jgi:hypothetical protein
VTEETIKERGKRYERYMAQRTAMMLPYDTNRPCPKCLFPHATTEYKSAHFAYFSGSTETSIPIDPRRMVRICPNCKHSWNERPLDESPAGGATGD